jgi:2-keto-4-pentenoate hydratase/2-oxohepta-3-ene-1,7-dioic acid hydratase in catechol pathway
LSQFSLKTKPHPPGSGFASALPTFLSTLGTLAHFMNFRHFPNRIFCIGRNYVEHVRELNNPMPAKPIIFMKPASSLAPPGETIRFPSHGKELHHETEVVVGIGKAGKPSTAEEAEGFIQALTLGLDLTLRDVQREMKTKGLPWELAKSFDQSAPLGDMVPYRKPLRFDAIQFACYVNGEKRQEGTSRDMIFPIPRLIMEVGTVWTLQPGDLIFTGTPAGIGPLNPRDKVEISSPQLGSWSWSIV